MTNGERFFMYRTVSRSPLRIEVLAAPLTLKRCMELATHFKTHGCVCAARVMKDERARTVAGLYFLQRVAQRPRQRTEEV